jgi:predicted nucleic acid-binding protein
MTKYLLIDSCYWFGLFNKSDQHHQESIEISEIIEDFTIVIPYPSLYEVLNSAFIKDKLALIELENLIKSEKVILLYDENYRDYALKNVYEIHRKSIPHISLVDSVIREMIKDINLRIDALVTFNKRDFKDVCDIRNITIIP